MITLKETRLELKEGTKTVFTITEEKPSIEITKDQYNNYVESAPFYRRLGGSETLTRAYTCQGYKVVKIVSRSPCKTEKIIREFDFL